MLVGGNAIKIIIGQQKMNLFLGFSAFSIKINHLFTLSVHVWRLAQT